MPGGDRESKIARNETLEAQEEKREASLLEKQQPH